MRPEDHRLTLEDTDPLVQTALAAANSCYAPYTRSYAGIAFRSADRKIYPERYAENAAYNSSLLAFQSALAFMKMQLGVAASLEIVEAVLVEKSPERTSQREATRLLLESISPQARLTYYAL